MVSHRQEVGQELVCEIHAVTGSNEVMVNSNIIINDPALSL